MAGFPCSRAQMMIRFWTSGTAAGPISTPRSPRATMTASEALTIWSSSSSASAFSILAMISAVESGLEQLPQGSAVLRRAHERERDVVDAEPESELEIPQILLGQGRNGDRDPGQVYALVRLHRAADEYGGAGANGIDLVHAQAHATVVDQDVVADEENLLQDRRADRQCACGAVLLARDVDLVALDEHERMRQLADSELRALQVGDER